MTFLELLSKLSEAKKASPKVSWSKILESFEPQVTLEYIKELASNNLSEGNLTDSAKAEADKCDLPHQIYTNILK